MLTTEGLIAIISLCLTCFSLGYSVGSKSNTSNKTQKNHRASRLSVAPFY